MEDVAREVRPGGGLLWPGRRRLRRHHGLTARVSELLGQPVGVAVPLQRFHPSLVFAVCVAELVALGAVIITETAFAFLLLVGLATALVALWAANGHRVLAVTSTGVIILAASASGRPLATIDTAPADLALAPPAGLGVAVHLRNQVWWVDRSAFPRLARARELLPTAAGATEAESPESSS